MGRRTYEVEDRNRPLDLRRCMEGLALRPHYEAPATVPDWMTGTFVHEGIESAVAQAKAAAGDRKVGLLGAGMARQCLEAGLLDEIVVQVAPVMLGDGVRLFDPPAGRQIKLGRPGSPSPVRSRTSRSESFN